MQSKVVDIDQRERVGADKVKYHSALSKASCELWVDMGAMQRAWNTVSVHLHSCIHPNARVGGV